MFECVWEMGCLSVSQEMGCLSVSREEWEVGDALGGKGESRLMSFGPRPALKLLLVGMETRRDRTMGWPLGRYSYSASGVREGTR